MSSSVTHLQASLLHDLSDGEEREEEEEMSQDEKELIALRYEEEEWIGLVLVSDDRHLVLTKRLRKRFRSTRCTRRYHLDTEEE